MRFLFLTCALFLLSCSDPASEQLFKPVINSISFDRSQIYINQFITVQANVTDEDGDPLKYAWTADGGTFTSATNNPTQWHAGAQAGTFTLTLSVSDGTFSVSDSRQIKVIVH
jgi:hypothetical protein